MIILCRSTSWHDDCLVVARGLCGPGGCSGAARDPGPHQSVAGPGPAAPARLQPEEGVPHLPLLVHRECRTIPPVYPETKTLLLITDVCHSASEG